MATNIRFLLSIRYIGLLDELIFWYGRNPRCRFYMQCRKLLLFLFQTIEVQWLCLVYEAFVAHELIMFSFFLWSCQAQYGCGKRPLGRRREL